MRTVVGPQQGKLGLMQNTGTRFDRSRNDVLYWNHNVGSHSSSPSWDWSAKLWRGCTTWPQVLETARDASKTTAEVACGCELCFDRLPRAVGSGQGARSVGRATDAVGYEDLRVLSVWRADKHHAEMDQRDERRQDRRLLTPVDGCGARENPGGLVLEFAFEPEPTRGVYELLHLRAHVAIAGRRPPSDAVGPAQIVVRDHRNVSLFLLCPDIGFLDR